MFIATVGGLTHEPREEIIFSQSYITTGILLWEIMTERVPHETVAQDFSLMDKIFRGLRPPVPRQYSNLPVVKLMTTCWSEKPNSRPSCEQILATLKVLDGIPMMKLD